MTRLNHAVLYVRDVEASVAEIDRAIGQLGALGVQMFTNVLGTTLDDPRLEPLFARVESLDRAVWLHPIRSFESNFGIWWSLGWPYETAAALSRLVYSGVMERHPRLKVLAHHGAGMVPHFSSRLNMGPGYREVKDSLALLPLEYFRRFYADTATFGVEPLLLQQAIAFFGVDRVMFGSDTPMDDGSGETFIPNTLASIKGKGDHD